jgi:hypothetical protein
VPSRDSGVARGDSARVANDGGATSDRAAPRGEEGRFPLGAALIVLWLALALAVVARRMGPAEESRLEDRPVPPVTIDLNNDPWPRLLLIEGIGEALARRIVAAREECGGFSDLAEVQALPGVPDDAIERARPWLRLGPRQVGATQDPAVEESRTEER